MGMTCVKDLDCKIVIESEEIKEGWKAWQMGSHLIMHRTNGRYRTPNRSPLVH